MRNALDLLDPAPLVVAPDLSIAELAARLLETGRDGACVMDGDELVGVVTSMDLIYQEKRVHLPSVITIMDLVIPLGSAQAEAELSKIGGTTVREIMSAPPRTVGPQAEVDEIASLMVDLHISLVPVIEDGRLLGAVTKPSVLRAAFGRRG
jgi:CBS domain-containing protein